MAYIGKQPIVGNYQVLDALTATATDTYALTKNSVAVYPQTPANCIVSLNGVIQAPYDSYTISGSNIVFASALTGSDSIDFITVLGDVLNVGTVSDGTITTAKLADSSVSLAKLTATGTKDATTFLRGDNTFSVPAGGVNTPAFLATTSLGNTTTGATTLFKFDSEIFDTDNCFNNTAGNYRFTPTTAGKYFLYTQTLPYNVGPTYNLNDRQLYIMKNGTAIARCTQLTSGGSTYGEEMNCSVIGEANGTTDYFDVRYEITVGSSTLQHDGGACNFFGYKIIE